MLSRADGLGLAGEEESQISMVIPTESPWGPVWAGVCRAATATYV